MATGATPVCAAVATRRPTRHRYGHPPRCCQSPRHKHDPAPSLASKPLTTHDVAITDERILHALHAGIRGPAERGNSPLKTSFKALRRGSLCPWRIGAITAAALVLLHHVHGRTT